jgi:hypothetical protein
MKCHPFGRSAVRNSDLVSIIFEVINMNINQDELKKIEGLRRIEVTSKDEMGGVLTELTHAVYPHEELYGEYCSIQTHIDCPPEKVYEYMAKTHCLEEWTYSVRDFKPSGIKDTYVGVDKLGGLTKIFCKTVANKEALTVDYHCAWDQGEHLWMIYLNRIVPAKLVFDKPGSVVFWQNCRHPFYNDNPFKDKAPQGRPWVGDFWDMFYAGHWVELMNLKAILEYRHRNGLPIGPYLNAGVKE